MTEQDDKTVGNAPASRNAGVLAKVKSRGRASWKNFFGVFTKSSEGSVSPGQSSKSEHRPDNRRPLKKVKEINTKVGFKNLPSSSKTPEDPLALKVTLPSNISNSDLSVSFEIEPTEGKKKTKRKDKSKMYLTCTRKTEKMSEFEGQLILPPYTDIDRLAKMPLYFVDTEGNPLKSDNDDYTVFQPVKNTLSKNVDIGMKIKNVHLKVKLEKFNITQKPQRIPKYLSCSFVTTSQCPPNPSLVFDDEFDFFDDDDEVEEDEGETVKSTTKKEIKVKQEGISTESSEKIVTDILHSVMSMLPIKDECAPFNYKDPDYLPKKASADIVLPRSSCATVHSTAYSDISSYFQLGDSAPQNSPNELVIPAKMSHDPPCQGDDYYNHSRRLNEDERELLEHQRRVQELDRTLELLQTARVKLTNFLNPEDLGNVKKVEPGKLYQLLPLTGVPPVSYLCAQQSPGKSSSFVQSTIPMEMDCAQEDLNRGMVENIDEPAPSIMQCASSNMEAHGDLPLEDDPSALIVKAQTKLEEELQKFKEKDRSKSSIEFLPQHKYLRSTPAAVPKMKLNTIQNLYFSPNVTVEFDSAAYEGLSSLYDKRYSVKNDQSLAKKENDITYSIVENDIKSMIHDLLKETWNIKGIVQEHQGKDKRNGNDDDLISLMEHDILERESFTNSAFLSDLKHCEDNTQKQEVTASKEDTAPDYPRNVSTVAIPYQVNYCMVNNPRKSPMVTVNKLKTYHDLINDKNLTGRLEISAGMTNILNEMYGLDSNNFKEVHFFPDDNISDKKDSATNETFESQYSKGYNVLIAEIPTDKTKTKFILNAAQIQRLGNDDDSANADDDMSRGTREASIASSMANRSALKSTKFVDINTTKTICETDTDFTETEISTVYSTTPEVMQISSLNSQSLREATLIPSTAPTLQTSCDFNDDETVIRETDLTKKIISLPMLYRKEVAVTSQQISHISQQLKFSTRSKSACQQGVSSGSQSEEPSPTLVILKEAVAIISKSDSEGIRMVQPNPVEDSDSYIPLKLKKPLEDIVPIAGTSRMVDSNIDSCISAKTLYSTVTEDYDADTDENISISLPNLTYKHTSMQELNTDEEIEEIELNVRQNDNLHDSNSKVILRTDTSFELNMDDSSSYMSTQSSLLLTEDEAETTIK